MTQLAESIEKEQKNEAPGIRIAIPFAKVASTKRSKSNIQHASATMPVRAETARTVADIMLKQWIIEDFCMN
ncbi:MAG: hypothetical protein K9M96_04065 [Deltaproteobacteria bacterium]|nr:hypothetical protein [Deltaproteobacteria bacterium]